MTEAIEKSEKKGDYVTNEKHRGIENREMFLTM